MPMMQLSQPNTRTSDRQIICKNGRRVYTRWILSALGAFALTACAESPDLSPPTTRAEPAAIVDVHYVTTRASIPTAAYFSGQRALEPSFGRITVGVPRQHQLGSFEVAEGRPDPEKHFHQRGLRGYASLPAMLGAAQAAGDGLLIFVHGYNNSFTESVFRIAQIFHDADQDAAAIGFQWASLGDPGAYVYDRDSVMLAREPLADLIESAARQTREPLRIVAHSMGSLLVVEALVRLGLEGKRGALSRIDEVILMSPDIDLELFSQQLTEIPMPRSRFGVVINRKDRILGLSSLLAGRQSRTGAAPDSDGLRALGVRVFDVTRFSDDGDPLGHFLPATSPELLSIMRARPDL